MQEISKEIYDKYATKRIGLYEFNRHLPPQNRKFASATIDYPSMIGMLGETISKEKLTKDGYKVYCAETYFFFLETIDLVDASDVLFIVCIVSIQT